MAKRVGVDKWLFGIVLLLVLFGLVMVFSASAVMAKATLGSPYSYVAKQALWVLLGLIAMAILMQVDYRKYNNQKFVSSAMVVELLLLLAVFAMPGSHHTHRWIRFGGLFTFQPSEIAKPVLILYLAYFLQSRIHLMDDLTGTVLKAVALPAVLTVLIAAEPDLGTAIVCVAVTVLMLYLAGAKVWHLSIPLMAATPALAYMLLMVPWRLARIRVFLNPEADPRGAGFHILQSLIAVGTGGLRGLGLMEGRQKLFYLPEPHTDFIFANVCEELGLLGAICVVALFVALGYRGLRAAVLSTDPFARFLAFGLTTAILVQAFFNMSVVLALLPTKGIPLPLISSGGTSVFITLAGMGVLLNVTREID
ncbi:putative lipid II flippase FtsW [Granulicella sp. dw_53]|uniref:putative lipid II flippase FtsW n=1 Tax=Granulicella sp. dw_53 TaxID=2719792 RepID=UPI001BD1FE6C|nr:putative lipid II flippase FtsW [Granulicella sp. dw_53]